MANIVDIRFLLCYNPNMRQNPYEDKFVEFDINKKSADDKKKRNRKINIIIYIIAGLLFLTAGILLFREFVYIPEQEYVDPSLDVQGKVEEPLGTPVSDYDIVPVLLSFTNQEISCRVSAVGIDSDNVMESVEDAQIASWLSVDPYVTPGDIGNAVIGGHNLWRGEAGTFTVLKRLQLGDPVAVKFDNGEWRFFEVIETHECNYDDSTYMNTDTDEALLTLITCKGDWNTEINTSQTRVVVVCKRVTAQ